MMLMEEGRILLNDPVSKHLPELKNLQVVPRVDSATPARPANTAGGGAGGTAFWIDPKEQMVLIFMTLGLPGPRRGEDRDLLRNFVPAAIVD